MEELFRRTYAVADEFENLSLYDKRRIAKYELLQSLYNAIESQGLDFAYTEWVCDKVREENLAKKIESRAKRELRELNRRKWNND